MRDSDAQYPDLPRDTETYRAHQSTIEGLLREAWGARELIEEVLAQSQKRFCGCGAHARVSLPRRNFPRLGEIVRPMHVNCYGLQLLFHTLAMESFRCENDGKFAADLRHILERVASVWISVRNFEGTRRMIDYGSTIRDTDRRIRGIADGAVEVPSLVPFLCSARSVITELKRILGERKFRDGELILNLAELFPGDEHVLHFLCMALATSGSRGDIETVLRDWAERKYEKVVQRDSRMRDPVLRALLQENSHLFSVFIISLVESGQTDRALQWCERPEFQPLLTQCKWLALKYVAALRHQRKFAEAMRFCRGSEGNPALADRRFAQEFKMACAGYDGIHPLPLAEFQERYGGGEPPKDRAGARV